MRMREATFLKFDDMDMCHDSAEAFLFDDVREKSLQFESEHSSDNIRTILRRLSWHKGIEYLLPLRIASRRDEEIWFAT